MILYYLENIFEFFSFIEEVYKWNNFLEEGLDKLKLMKFNHDSEPFIWNWNW
jgi:hypothetical protein